MLSWVSPFKGASTSRSLRAQEMILGFGDASHAGVQQQECLMRHHHPFIETAENIVPTQVIRLQGRQTRPLTIFGQAADELDGSVKLLSRAAARHRAAAEHAVPDDGGAQSTSDRSTEHIRTPAADHAVPDDGGAQSTSDRSTEHIRTLAAEHAVPDDGGAQSTSDRSTEHIRTLAAEHAVPDEEGAQSISQDQPQPHQKRTLLRRRMGNEGQSFQSSSDSNNNS